MNTNTSTLTGRLAILAAVSILTICADAPVLASTNDGVRAAIEAQSKAFTDGLERADPKAAASVFTADAELILSGLANVVGGRESIQNFWQSAIKHGVTGMRLSTIDLEGAGSQRVEIGTYQVMGPGGADLGRGYYMFVWKQEDGAWKIHRDIGSETPVPENVSEAGDRVGFPQDYRAALKLLGVSVKDDEPSVMSAYGNDLATSITASSQLPYPYGTVIAMEFAHGTRDGEGQILRDPKGVPLKADVARVDVMRRERGYGEAYGENRAGEWEFASYRPDGSTLIAPAAAGACAACHRKAGAERDFVYRIRVPAK